MIVDAKARETALDPSQSFIIQAPAGSGKTELLTQRFLVLLGRVQEPEEIVALTFTRKAAGEMRHRILKALKMAQSLEVQPDHEPAKTTWLLGRQVLERSDERGWDLIDSPHRLQLSTIDSLCQNVVRQLPFSRAQCSHWQVSDDTLFLYQEAVMECLQMAYDGHSGYEPVLELLRYFDNDPEYVKDILVRMLQMRVQWVHLFADWSPESREESFARLEEFRKILVEESLAKLDAQLTQEWKESWTNLYGDVLEVLDLLDPEDQKIQDLAWVAQKGFPQARLQDLDDWKSWIENMTSYRSDRLKFALRKRFTKKDGFPAKSFRFPKELSERLDSVKMKETILALLEELEESSEALALMWDISLLPSQQVRTEIVHFFGALRLVLAHLAVVFEEYQQCDFDEIALQARQALQDRGAQNSIAFCFHCKISHLLVDEFQDTSYLQGDLLESLLSEWESQGENTLFLVGDPMQSIYGFRQAQVGLYLKCLEEEKLAHIKLVPLRLEVNFRSQGGLIQWFNQVFSWIFPNYADIKEGAVPFSLATSIHPVWQEGKTLRVYGYEEDHSREKALLEVTEQILKLRQSFPQDSVAILARARRHLSSIVSYLEEKEIAYDAQKMDVLVDQYPVIELITLTKMALYPHDEVAQIAFLKAPWLALDQREIQLLLEFWREESPFENLGSFLRHNYLVWSELLPEPHRERAKEIFALMRKWEQHPISDLAIEIEKRWLVLGGEQLSQGVASQLAVETYLDLLQAQQRQGTLPDWIQFEEYLKLQRLSLPVKEGSVQLMTIHASKGLEFDHVFLLGLGEGSRKTDPELIQVERFPLENQGEILLLDACHRRSETEGQSAKDQGALYDYLVDIKKRREHFEVDRLLYVAVTRAKKGLHLCGKVRKDSKKPDTLVFSKTQANWETFWNSASSDEDRSVHLATDETKARRGMVVEESHPWQTEIPQTLNYLVELPRLKALTRELERRQGPSFLPKKLDLEKDLATSRSSLLLKPYLTSLRSWLRTRGKKEQVELLQDRDLAQRWLEKWWPLGEKSGMEQSLLEKNLRDLLSDERWSWIRDHQKEILPYEWSVLMGKKVRSCRVDLWLEVDQQLWAILLETSDEVIEIPRKELLFLHQQAQDFSGREVKVGWYQLWTRRWYELG